MTYSWADSRVGAPDPAEWNYPGFITKPYEGANGKVHDAVSDAGTTHRLMTMYNGAPDLVRVSLQ